MSTYSTRLAKYRPFHYWGRPEQDFPVVMQKKETKRKPMSLQELRDKVFTLSVSFDWLKWFLVISLPALLLLMTYFHSDTKQEIQKLEADIKEIRTLLIELIQKQTDTKPKLRD